MPGDDGSTLALAAGAPAAGSVRRVRVTVVEGPAPGVFRDSQGERLAIGSDRRNDLVVDEPTLSRFHCELRVAGARAVVEDLGSTNGTFVNGVEVQRAVLAGGAQLRLGNVVLRFELLGDDAAPPLSTTTRFGRLVGTSVAMRRTIALLERAAASDVTVLLEGETGTGKGNAAEALHEASPRRDQPFIVVDCGAIPANLLESELCGHEKGAFTGADARRVGAFEEASGGTVFLDEIGELPGELQPKLLRILENREVKRVGANRFVPIDIRVVAATNRDLRAGVNAGTFRADLYYRLAVVKIPLPSLRERAEDLPVIAEELVRRLRLPAATAARLLAPASMAALSRMPWPGNVRELRNHLERAAVFGDDDPLAPAAATETELPLAYAEARRLALLAFERRYLELLLERSGGRVAEAATVAGVDRVYLYRLMRRHGLKPG